MSDLQGMKAVFRRLLEEEAGAHGWDHAERVWNLCEHIGTREGADLEILEFLRPEKRFSASFSYVRVYQGSSMPRISARVFLSV